MKIPFIKISSKWKLWTSTSYTNYESTTTSSTVIWIRIRHTATVPSIGERIHTVYAVKPVGYFLSYNLPTENIYTLYMPFSPLAIFLCCTPRSHEHIHTVYVFVALHACSISRTMTFFNTFLTLCTRTSCYQNFRPLRLLLHICSNIRT